MEEQVILEEILLVLGQNDIEIRREAMGGGGGGLCKIRDKTIFFVDTEAQSADMAGLCAQALLGNVDIESIYLKPQIRDFIEKYGNTD